MTDLQRADLEAGQRGEKFNSVNSAALDAINLVDDTLSPIIEGIITQVQAVEEAEAAQQHDAGDVGTEKGNLKTAMGKIVIRYALRGEVKAASINNAELTTSLQHPVTYITDVDDVLAITHANDMKQIMNDNKGPAGLLTNIVAADIDLMTVAIKEFKDIASKPTDVIKEKKAQGTDKIQPEIDKLNDFTDAERKLLHSYWEGTDNNGLMDEFDLKTHPVVLGKRHNIAAIILLKDEDGKELKGGLVTCVKNKKTSDGANTNVYTIEGVQVGIQAFKAEAPGRVAVDFDVKIVRRKTVEVVVRMMLI